MVFDNLPERVPGRGFVQVLPFLNAILNEPLITVAQHVLEMAKVSRSGYYTALDDAEVSSSKTEWNTFLSIPAGVEPAGATLTYARKLLKWSDELLRIGHPTGDVMRYDGDDGSRCRAFAEVDALYELFEAEDGLHRPTVAGPM